MENSTLFHFLLMMKMGNHGFTKTNIEQYMNVALELEGSEYISDLKHDLDSVSLDEIVSEYGFERETKIIIFETIRFYEPKIEI